MEKRKNDEAEHSGRTRAQKRARAENERRKNNRLDLTRVRYYFECANDICCDSRRIAQSRDCMCWKYQDSAWFAMSDRERAYCQE